MDIQDVLEQTEQGIKDKGFTIVDKDWGRPWGGYFVIDEGQAQEFADEYFGGLETAAITKGGKLSPKILVVEPDKRLSWQYHHRRSELWTILEGPVGVVTSETDEQEPVDTFEPGEMVTLRQGVRHRLVGLDDFGVVAEIWQHTDSEEPSNEDDIVRLQDDFGR